MADERDLDDKIVGFVQHWEGLLIVVMLAVLLGFTVFFFTNIMLPFAELYPPSSAESLVVDSNYTLEEGDGSYEMKCSLPNLPRRGEQITCQYNASGPAVSGSGNSSLVVLNWDGYTGQRSTVSVLQPGTIDTTGNLTFHIPKQADRYDISLAETGVAQNATLALSPTGASIRVLTDTNKLETFFKLLVLLFNVLVLTSIWFSAGEVSVALMDRLERKEGGPFD